VTLKDDAPDPPFESDARAVTMPGQGAQRVTLHGRAAPLAAASPIRTFDGQLEFNDVSLAGVERFLAAETLQNSDAVLSGARHPCAATTARSRPRAV
jgi:hypothetical protein